MVLPEDSATVRRRMKKAEAAAAAAAEHAKKFGVCMVPFRMALLFSGECRGSACKPAGWSAICMGSILHSALLWLGTVDAKIVNRVGRIQSCQRLSVLNLE